MPEKSSIPGRDQALIGILERLADEMVQQDTMLEDILKRLNEFAGSVEASELHRRSRQVSAEQAHEKLFESFHHYRSDMLGLVNEQDHINKNINELQKMVRDTTYALETTNQRLVSLDERLKLQEKASQEHYEHSLKQAGAFHSEIAESSRNFTKLHADTEKHLGELHSETQRQMDKSQHEILLRLLALDGIVNSLQTLLIRTEPPEKRPPLVVRLFKKLVRFFSFKLPLLLKKAFHREKE